MNYKSFSKIAGISAIALIAAMHATDVSAQYVIGTDQQVDFNATVDNTITVAVTPGTFGTIAAMNSTAVGDTATAVLPAAVGPQVLVDDHSTGFGTAAQALIVGEDANPGTAAEVVVTNAFDAEEMFVTFSTCANLTNGTETFVLDDITTSMAGTPYDCTTPMTTGHTFTTAGGGFTFQVGASITTDGLADVAYPDGVYTGSVQMQITY